jgi:uncharacterized transporter YbjL
MKAVLTMSHRVYPSPSMIYHQVWDQLHTEKMLRIADRTLTVFLAAIGITGGYSFLTTLIEQLAGRSVIADFCYAMSKLIYTTF